MNILYKIKWHLKGLKNFWTFRKEIYSFRDFDYSYNLNLFTKSLEITRDNLKNGRTLSSPNDAKNIDKFLKTVDMDYYFWDYSEEFSTLMEKNVMKFKPTDDPNLSEMYFEGLSQEEEKRYKHLRKRSVQWEEARWNRSWRIIKDEMRGWWD